MTSREPEKRPSRPGRPRGPRRDPDERRSELLDAAARAIRRIGPQASMDELAAEAGITKPILYSHFGDRAGLVRALAERVAVELNQALISQLTTPREPVEVLSSTIEAFCTFIETEPELYRFLVQAAMYSGSSGGRSGHKLSSDISRQIAVSLGAALRRAGADSGAAEPWAFGIVGMTFAGAGWWLERKSMSKEDLVGYLTQLLWTGLSGAGLGRVEVEPAAGAPPAVRPRAVEPGASAKVTPLRERGSRSAASGD
ncbi:MAG TPA: TetR/AcrR family transcriptional regulator [Acidimicrobiales bacterium]|nr:TetR/AcrR family transcriptional regulator [Acidimicrobiales bacterium]